MVSRGGRPLGALRSRRRTVGQRRPVFPAFRSRACGAGRIHPEDDRDPGRSRAALGTLGLVRRGPRSVFAILGRAPHGAIGAFRPAILLPASIFTGLPPRGLEALIAHELAHIRRQDYLVNLLQAVAETLLFYHPAVWWVSARIRTEREQCCDDLAISATGDARSYARALVRIEEMRGATSALAVAAGGGNLWKRVVRLLRDEPASAESPSGWLAGTVALALLFVLGAAARVGPSGSIEGDDFGSGRALVSEPAPADVVVRAPAASPKSTGRHSGREAPDSDSNCKPVASPPRLGALSGEALVALRDHGVTGDFVRAVASLGYDRAEPDEILALKIHGVTPEDIAEMNRIFGKRPLDEHVAFKIHGVTADSVRRLSVLGLGKLSPNDVVAMRIHGVTPDLVRDIRSLGYTDPSPDDLVALRIHRVSVESIRKANARAGRLLPLDELIERRCEKDRDEK